MWTALELIMCILSILLMLHWFRKQEGFTRSSVSCDAFDAPHVQEYELLTFDMARLQADLAFLKPMLTEHSIVLDVGCGTGRHVHELTDQVNIVGLDKSMAMVKYARRKHPHQFSCGDAMLTDTFVPESFTHILCLYYTVYYMPNKRAFFENMITWLMPGGYLVLHVAKTWKYGPPANWVRPGVTYRGVMKAPYFRERITRQHELKVRHTVFMEPKETLIDSATSIGFIVDQVYQYDHNDWLYVLQKPAWDL